MRVKKRLRLGKYVVGNAVVRAELARRCLLSLVLPHHGIPWHDAYSASSHSTFFLAVLPNAYEERDVVHGTFDVQIRVRLSSADYLRGVPCRIEKERWRRGQLRERWLTVHRCGKRALCSIPIEA